MKIKQAADEEYPGLVKDIFIGKGSYNQDLMPRALIVEMGTHTIDKELALKSASKVADIVAYALGGAVPGQDAQSTQAPAKEGAAPQPGATVQPERQSAVGDTSQTKASVKGIGWIIGGVAAVGVAFLLIAMNSGGRAGRVGNFFRELTGTGKHKK